MDLQLNINKLHHLKDYEILYWIGKFEAFQPNSYHEDNLHNYHSAIKELYRRNYRKCRIAEKYEYFFHINPKGNYWDFQEYSVSNGCRG